jgi:hypothetical protein
MNAPAIQPLVDLLDSRQDLREILAKNLNLAHACLLLRRGESDSVEKALELALRQPDSDSIVIAECIRVELLRLSGDTAQALARAEKLSRFQRFHPAAVLYLRNLFPLIEAVAVDESAVRAPELHEPAQQSAQDGPPSHAEIPVVEDSQVSPEHPQSAEPEGAEGVPPAWRPIASDPSVVLLRLRVDDDLHEVRHEALPISAIEDMALIRSSQILVRLGFGQLRHCALDGSDRCVHAWSAAQRNALIVMATGDSTSLLAARCTKAFQEHQ